MKLSRREAVLISILLIVAVLFIEYKMVYVPQKERYDALVIEDQKVQADVDKINRLIISIPKLTADRDKVLSDISDVSTPFYDELNADALLWTAYENLVQNGMTLKSVSNSKIDVAQIDVPNLELVELSYRLKSLTTDYANAAAAVDAPEPTPTPKPTQTIEKEDKSDGIEMYQVFLDVAGSYDQIRNFIANVEALEKTITVTTLDMTSTDLPDLIDAQILISYYGTKKIAPTVDSSNQWSQPVYEGGSGNPFYSDGLIIAPTPMPSPAPTPAETTNAN